MARTNKTKKMIHTLPLKIVSRDMGTEAEGSSPGVVFSGITIEEKEGKKKFNEKGKKRVARTFQDVLAEKEGLSLHCISLVRSGHVGINLGEWHVKIEVQGEDSPGQEDNENGVRRVLVLSQLDLH